MKKKPNSIFKISFVLNFFINFLLLFSFVLIPIFGFKLSNIKIKFLNKDTEIHVIVFLVSVLLILISVLILVVNSFISFFYIKNYPKNKLILLLNSFLGLLGGLLIFGLVTSLFCVLKTSKK